MHPAITNPSAPVPTSFAVSHRALALAAESTVLVRAPPTCDDVAATALAARVRRQVLAFFTASSVRCAGTTTNLKSAANTLLARALEAPLEAHLVRQCFFIQARIVRELCGGDKLAFVAAADYLRCVLASRWSDEHLRRALATERAAPTRAGVVRAIDAHLRHTAVLATALSLALTHGVYNVHALLAHARTHYDVTIDAPALAAALASHRVAMTARPVCIVDVYETLAAFVWPRLAYDRADAPLMRRGRALVAALTYVATMDERLAVNPLFAAAALLELAAEYVLGARRHDAAALLEAPLLHIFHASAPLATPPLDARALIHAHARALVASARALDAHLLADVLVPSATYTQPDIDVALAYLRTDAAAA